MQKTFKAKNINSIGEKKGGHALKQSEIGQILSQKHKILYGVNSQSLDFARALVFFCKMKLMQVKNLIFIILKNGIMIKNHITNIGQVC